MSMKFHILRSQLETKTKPRDTRERSRSRSSDRGGKQFNFSDHGQRRMTTVPKQVSVAKNPSKNHRYIKDRRFCNYVYVNQSLKISKYCGQK